MHFAPYRLWERPSVVAFQDRRSERLIAVLGGLERGAHLLLHCSGTTDACLRSFRRLGRVQAAFPHVTFHLIANTDAELQGFRALGLPAAYGPVSLFVDEHTFRPEAVDKTHDAVYIARFTPSDRQHFKRHLLAAHIPSLSFITFALSQNHGSLPETGPFSSAFWATYPELRHAMVNDRPLSAPEVARGLNHARVHLALSAAEGCMLCFTEGLLCGVPGVSTPCRSARTEFFDARFVSVVRDDARAVADAVRDLAARGLDPQLTREYALARQRYMRERYVQYIATVVGEPHDRIFSHVFTADGGAHRLAYDASSAIVSDASVQQR